MVSGNRGEVVCVTQVGPLMVAARSKEHAEYVIRSRAEQRGVPIDSLDVGAGGAESQNCSPDSSSPVGANHARSFTPLGVTAWPRKNACCRNTGWSSRSRTRRATRSTYDADRLLSEHQDSHDTSLSWQ